MTYSVELKIKRLSLGAELRILRNEIRRSGRKGYANQVISMQCHRDQIVRRAARAAHLAHAFLVGRPYSSVERQGSRKLGAAEIKDIDSNVRRFGRPEHANMPKDEISIWIEGRAVLRAVA